MFETWASTSPGVIRAASEGEAPGSPEEGTVESRGGRSLPASSEKSSKTAAEAFGANWIPGRDDASESGGVPAFGNFGIGAEPGGFLRLHIFLCSSGDKSLTFASTRTRPWNWSIAVAGAGFEAWCVATMCNLSTLNAPRGAAFTTAGGW